MSWQGRIGFPIWLLTSPLEGAPAIKVVIAGIECTDYIRIIGGSGQHGIFFTHLSFEEARDIKVTYL